MTAVQYVPASGLLSIHGTARLLGQNYLTTEGLDTSNGMTFEAVQGTPMYNYVVGLIVPAVVMLIMFVIWCCSLICAKKCCKAACSKNVALFFFVLFCSTSLLGWILGLIGNVNTTQGFNAMLKGISDTQDFSERVLGVAAQTSIVAEDLFNLAVNMETECNNTNVPFPFGGISEGLNQSLDASGSGGITATLENMNDNIDTYKDLAAQFLSWRETGTMVVIVITMVILTIFMVATALRVMDSTPECCRPVAKCSSRSTSCLVFLFGILLLLVIWIFVAIIHVIVTFGADMCAPDINTSLNRLVNEAANQDFSEGNPCDIPEFRESTMGLLCYYQTCTGPNPLGDGVGDLNATGSADALLDFKAELLDQIAQFNITVNSTCFDSMDRFVNGTADVFRAVEDALALTECSEINPVYASLVYDGICNGMFNGLVFTYVSCIIACLFMMLAMSIFRIFDFNQYEEGRLPEGHYADVKGGQVVNTGGPVVKDV